MLTKKEISETLALSCVEKYFLAWLARDYDVTRLYGNSFVSLGQIFDDFAHGATYQNYCYLPRLQDIAEEYGVITHEYHAFSALEAIKLLKAQTEDVLCMIRVNTSFFMGYKRSSWREDHYVCVNNRLEWINEYPLSEGRFNEEDFFKVFDGAVCLYKRKDLSVIPPDCVTEEFSMQNFELRDLPKGLSKIEASVGVLRVVRKRLEKYYIQNKKVQSLLHEENVYLDKLYFDIHLRRLKEKKQQESEKEKPLPSAEIYLKMTEMKRNREKTYDNLCGKMEQVLQLEKQIAEELKVWMGKRSEKK